MFTLAVAGSRGRLAIVGVETVDQLGQPRPLLAVRLAEPLAHVGASPAEQAAAVTVAEAKVIGENAGREPRLVVAYGGLGTTLYEFLREDYKRGRRHERPSAVTHNVSSNDGRAYQVSLNALAARLALQWRERRLTFAPGLDRLRSQVASFAPAETKAGNLTLDEADAYDGSIVALMYALSLKGLGTRRFQDASGKVWPSRAIAKAHLGSASQEADSVYRVTTFGAVSEAGA